MFQSARSSTSQRHLFRVLTCILSERSHDPPVHQPSRTGAASGVALPYPSVLHIWSKARAQYVEPNLLSSLLCVAVAGVSAWSWSTPCVESFFHTLQAKQRFSNFRGCSTPDPCRSTFLWVGSSRWTGTRSCFPLKKRFRRPAGRGCYRRRNALH
jgi:hypothetical protein